MMRQRPPQGAPGGPTGGTGGVPRPSPHAPFNPQGDTATYRDLLLFEERLKMNAEMLARRRRRYNAFLWSFVGALVWLVHRWLFTPSKNILTMRAVQASIAVVVITLVLFFASGMYEEKIRYAHSYITHSNKALRPLNMHLNLRRPPASFPIPFFRKSHAQSPPSSSANTSTASASAPAPTKSLNRRQSTTSTVMASIPPSHNPRGELIFSSRVDKTFREGYERYRAAFERRREEKAREEARRNARWFNRSRPADLVLSHGAGVTPTPPGSRRGTPPPGAVMSVGGEKGDKGMGVGEYTRRGRTPSPGLGGSRLRNSVDLGTAAGGAVVGGNGHGNGTGTGTSGTSARDGKRERAESYSFVWSHDGPKRAP